MSLAKYQEPRNNTKIVGISYPTYYTCLTDLYSYSDFRYRFRLYTDNGLEFTTLNKPYKNEHLGVFDSTPIINNLTDIDFNPDITNEFKYCSNAMLQYRVVVDEFSNSISSPDSKEFSKVILFRNFDEDFNYEDYIMRNSNEGKFLTRQTEPVELTLNQRGVLRLLSGRYDYYYDSKVYQLELFRKDSNGIEWVYISNFVNSYYSQSESNSWFSSNNSDLSELVGGVLDVGVGPYNVNNSKWKLVGYLDVNGGWHTLTPTIETNILECGDTYTINTYTWPYGTGGQTSTKFHFKVVESNEDSIQLMWENLEGGWDTFNFNKIYKKSISNKQNIMKQNRWKQGHDSTHLNNPYYIGHNDYDREDRVYSQDIKEMWTLNTGYQSDEYLNNLKDLWTSKNIYLFDGEKWYPVISTIEGIVTDTNDINFRNIEINLVVSNKKIV